MESNYFIDGKKVDRATYRKRIAGIGPKYREGDILISDKFGDRVGLEVLGVGGCSGMYHYAFGYSGVSNVQYVLPERQLDALGFKLDCCEKSDINDSTYRKKD